MRRTLRFPLPVLAAALLTLGCGSDSPTRPNQPPVVSLTRFPATGSLVGESTEFRWTGVDPDGAVAGYEVSLDSDSVFAVTGSTDTLFTFTREDGTETQPQIHVFRVRAVDDRGLTGNLVAWPFEVAFPNGRPVVVFVEVPPDTGYAGPTPVLAWSGSDPDGAVDHYEYAVDDTTGAWTSTPDTTVTLDFSGYPAAPRGAAFAPADLHREVTFHLRAVDDQGKQSVPIRTSFISGPPAVPPEVALVSAPQGVVTGTATWTWAGSDRDGTIIRYQWALDGGAASDWKTVGPTTTSITRTFTRADGTAESPVLHVFHLRAQDDDSTYSAALGATFQVGVPNDPPTVKILAPTPGTASSYQFAARWSATDPDGVAGYEFALDDDAAWTPAGTATTWQFKLTCTDSTAVAASPNPAAPLADAFGRHRLRVRARDALDAVSAPVEVAFMTRTKTPYTTLLEPSAPDGQVTGSTSITLRWTGTDVDRAGGQKPVGYDLLQASVPPGPYADGAAAVQAALDAGAGWQYLGDGVTEVTRSIVSGNRYVLALRARDEAQAVEPYFHFGRNVLLVTAP